MEVSEIPILLTDKKQGKVYEYLGIDGEMVSVRNLTSGSEVGKIPKATAKKNLGFSIHLNQLVATNPAMLTAIKELGLCVIMPEQS